MKWTTTRRNGVHPAGLRLDEVTLSHTGGPARRGCWNQRYGDGHWIRVRSQSGFQLGMVRTLADLPELGIDPESVCPQILDTVATSVV